LLRAHEVRFLVIGGYAVNAFGYVRNTVAIDVWIDSEPGNQRRVIHAVRDFGFSSASDDVLDGPRAMLRMGVAPVRIEVMKKISGVEFNHCWDRRVEFQIEDLAVPMISLPDLKANKLASGRPKDLLDLSELP